MAVVGSMPIASLPTGPSGPAVPDYPGGVRAAAATLHAMDGEARVDDQLQAYQALAGQWRGARHDERAALAQAINESPFGQRVQSTLDRFTRAAWAGPGAQPPEPQARILQAFDALSADDQKIVAAMQVDARGVPAFASPPDYRARLQADLDAAQADGGRKSDVVTLSPEAQAHLAGTAKPPAPESPPAAPAMAAALAAYSRAGR